MLLDFDLVFGSDWSGGLGAIFFSNGLEDLGFVFAFDCGDMTTPLMITPLIISSLFTDSSDDSFSSFSIAARGISVEGGTLEEVGLDGELEDEERDGGGLDNKL